MADVAHTLADIAAATYDANPAAGLPPGFTTVDLPNLGMSGGVYANGHGLALVGQGVLDGEQVLVVAIRGTDDAHDWIADVQNINDEYAALKPLAAALETYAAAGGKVVLTGHSMGGAMDQIFMAQHPNDDHYRAVTFGSPGALPQQGMFSVEADARITNYVISDDPFVFLGEHRGEVANYALNNLAAGLGLAAELATVTHLTAANLLPTVRSLGADYVNNGATITIAGAGGPLTLAGLAHADLSEHDPGTYAALTATSALVEPSLWTADETRSSVVGGESISGGAGDDNLAAAPGGGNATISGGAGADTLQADSGASSLSGGDGNDVIVGGSGFDNINGNKGDDTINGGLGGGDWLVGGQGNDLITSQHSDDLLYGNLGDDTLNGGDGAEIIRGGQGDDVLTGGAGADWLSGDRGADTLTGGTGTDTFHTFSGAGLDLVTDFHASEGDRVQLDPGTAYTIAQVGGDTVIELGGDDKMILLGVQASSLPDGWIFGA